MSAPRRNASWTLQEVRKAQQMAVEGVPRADIAACLGRTVYGIHHKVKGWCPAGRRFTAADRKKAYTLKTEGREWKEVAKMTGYSGPRAACDAAKTHARKSGAPWPVEVSR